MRSLVLGASAGLGRALSEALAARGHTLFLVATDERDLEAVASDLALRHGVSVFHMVHDLAGPDVSELKARVGSDLGGLDNLFCVAGFSAAEQDSGTLDEDLLKRLAEVNFLGPVRVINAFLEMLAAGAKGNLVGIGSVAAVRPRGKNTVYGAAKRGLEFYFGAARHSLSPRGCAVQFYRAGYLDTAMNFGQKRPFPKMPPERAAAKIVANLGKDGVVAYLPAWWWFIMTAYRLLPFAILRRLKS